MQTHGKRKHEFLIIGPDIKSIDLLNSMFRSISPR